MKFGSSYKYKIYRFDLCDWDSLEFVLVVIIGLVYTVFSLHGDFIFIILVIMILII